MKKRRPTWLDVAGGEAPARRALARCLCPTENPFNALAALLGGLMSECSAHRQVRTVLASSQVRHDAQVPATRHEDLIPIALVGYRALGRGRPRFAVPSGSRPRLSTRFRFLLQRDAPQRVQIGVETFEPTARLDQFAVSPEMIGREAAVLTLKQGLGRHRWRPIRRTDCPPVHPCKDLVAHALYRPHGVIHRDQSLHVYQTYKEGLFGLFAMHIVSFV